MAEELLVHVGWVCQVCGKYDTLEGTPKAKPEHVPHRGYDIGSCPGVMEKVYRVKSENHGGLMDEESQEEKRAFYRMHFP